MMKVQGTNSLDTRSTRPSPVQTTNSKGGNNKNAFSKVADLNIPDSPPPQEKPDDTPDTMPGGKPGMGKFEQLMKAAVSIKSAQLDQKKKKFEKLPTFLKAGVYYSNKLELVRTQQDFFAKLFAFEIIRSEGLREFSEKNYDRACRKFEEALSVFRYHISYNPKWQEQGIDDDEIKEVDEQGRNEFERQELRKLKLGLFLNIAACNIKTKDYETAVLACNEALKLDPYNVKGLYRRARAVSLPINSGVEDFRNAMVDLRRIVEVIDPNHHPSLKELKRLQKLVEVNRKREKDTYSKMFHTQGAKGVSDFVEEQQKKQTPLNQKTLEEQEWEKERAKLDTKVRAQMKNKAQEFSFEVLPENERKHFPEMDDLQMMIDKAEESYRLFKKTGRGKEAKMVRLKLEEALFAKEHLFHVMNLDFSRPTTKLIEMARKNNIDLTDQQVIEEFRRIQQQNLEDIRRMKEGKKPLTDEEMKAKLQALRDEEHQDARKQLEKSQKKKDESVRKLVENTLQGSQAVQESALEEEARLKGEQTRHYLALAAFLVVWLAFIVHQNFDFTSPPTDQL